MARLESFDAEKLLEEAQSPSREAEMRRFQYLVDYKYNSGPQHTQEYSIIITVDPKLYAENSSLLTEHNQIKNFQRSNNRYYYHPVESHPPVEAHYHIIGPRGKEEIYSVTLSGKAHHQKHKGKPISKREADELRKLGVSIGPDNIIESIEEATGSELLLTESIESQNYIEVLVVIEREA